MTSSHTTQPHQDKIFIENLHNSLNTIGERIKSQLEQSYTN